MKLIKIAVLFFILLFSFSCQNEEIIINEEPSTENLTGESPLVNLLARVARNPTSHDNILDNSSCFSIQLPVTVIVNGTQVQVASNADYQIVQNAIEAFTNDDDIVNFIFPITIKFQNFNTQIVTNSNQLDNIIDNCDDDDDFDEISCVNINFPIYINTYNNGNQSLNTVAIQSKSALFNFLRNIIANPNITITIQYPISMINANGVTVVVNSNEELLELIEGALEDCGNGNSNSGANQLQTVIVDGTWYISYYFRNNSIQTEDFNGYNFTFNVNNTILATGNGNSIEGTWEIESNGNEKKIEFEFEEDILERLSEKWKVVEYTNTEVRLRLVGGGNGGNNYMYINKN